MTLPESVKLNEITVLSPPCGFCKKITELKVPAEGYIAWQDGGLIQEEMPDLSADDREILMSGTCVSCWAKEYEQDDEEEDEEEDEDN